MKRVLVAAACTLLLGLVATQAAAETKWVRGKVTAVGGDSVTLDVMGKAMTFKVDSKTDVIEKGGSTATREAQAAGRKGPTLAELLKVGDGVEVHYNEVTTMVATEIRGGIAVGAGAASKEEPMGAMSQDTKLFRLSLNFSILSTIILGLFVNKLKPVWRVNRTTEEKRTVATDKIG